MKSAKSMLVLMCLCLFVASLILIGQSSAAIDKKNVIGVWLLNDNGGTVAKDSSANKNDGTIKGKPKWIDGKFGKALQFDGASSVDIDNPDNFDFTTWTYSFWFKASAGGDYPNLIGRQFSNTWGWTIHLDPARATFRIRIDSDGGINQLPTVAAKVADGEWHHGVICQDDSKKKQLTFYFDGIKGQGTYLGNYKPTGGFLTIAAPCVGAVAFNNGAIDDVAIFDTLLAEDDILSIMDKGLEAAMPSVFAVSPEGRLVDTWGDLNHFDSNSRMGIAHPTSTSC